MNTKLNIQLLNHIKDGKINPDYCWECRGLTKNKYLFRTPTSLILSSNPSILCEKCGTISITFDELCKEFNEANIVIREILDNNKQENTIVKSNPTNSLEFYTDVSSFEYSFSNYSIYVTCPKNFRGYVSLRTGFNSERPNSNTTLTIIDNPIPVELKKLNSVMKDLIRRANFDSK